MANKYEEDAALRREGLIDLKQESIAKESKRPIDQHVDDFHATMEAKQRSAKHVRMTRQHIEWVLDEASIDSVGDMRSAAVVNAIGELRRSGRSLSTCNAYLAAIKQFSRWLWKEKRAADDPLTGLAKFNEQEDQRHIRREMSADEVAYLLTFTEGHTTANHNLAGPDRAMLYRVAFGTGFRANELRSLSPRSFDLEAARPTVTVEASYSKRRRRDVQPIREDLAELLRPWLAEKPASERLFGRMPGDTARMMRKDLASARAVWLNEVEDDQAELERRTESSFLMYQDHDGRFADFHAARHTYISQIVAGGSSVKVAQELARHSTSQLTVDRYAHTQLHDVAAALEALPAAKPDEPERQVMAATGTDNASPGDSGAHQMRTKSDAKQLSKNAEDSADYQTVATRCDEPASGEEKGDAPNLLSIAEYGDSSRPIAAYTEEAPPGFEPGMADLQNGVSGRKCRGLHGFCGPRSTRRSS